MVEQEKTIRLINAAKELNVGIATITDHLKEKGFKIDTKPTTKLTLEMYQLLLQNFQSEKSLKEEAEKIELGTLAGKTEEKKDTEKTKNLATDKTEYENKEILIKTNIEKLKGTTIVGQIKLKKEEITPPDDKAEDTKEEKKETPSKETGEAKTASTEKTKETPEEKTDILEKTTVEKLEGPKIVGKIDIPDQKKKPIASSSDNFIAKRKKRRIKTKTDARPNLPDGQTGTKKITKQEKQKKRTPEIKEKMIQEQVKSTLAKLTSKSKGVKHKKTKKNEVAEEQIDADGKKNITLTEFIPVNELASLLEISVNEVITACMNLGIVVSINQRLDAEIIELVADEFDFKVSFIDVKEQEEILEEEEEDKPEDLVERPPVVTIMGHVDHGKTRLLDHIRKTNIIGGEAGGITQHIGAYGVTLPDGKKIAFLDTPGHEAFTAMRARGAKITDVAVIVIAADEKIMPQTKEAISHAQAAGVSLVFAINKIDKENANPEKIKEELSGMNLLVEDWGGKYQSQEISAKVGTNVDLLLEKILLEAEMLELKANPNKKASGSIIEASLQKGKGHVTTLLVQAGTLRPGDMILAGSYYGKVKSMFDERENKLTTAGPSMPTQILGLNGAPQAGDKFKVIQDEQEVKRLAVKRQQIIREQGIRIKKHITLDEIGRRISIGNFKELNLVIKADVDGSVEALMDSLLKLSTEEVQVNIIHSGVGQITESDILLASASDAIIIAFQVRPSLQARKLAEKEEIQIKIYSIIYDAINEIKSAIEGMHAPTIEEKIIANIEVKDIFKVSKVGTIAGCQVKDGKITRKNSIRVIRDGAVIYTGKLSSLKRFKDDVKEVVSGMECGISIENFNDIKAGDTIESFEQVEVKKKTKKAE